jgi:hypothetical protein
MLVPVMLLRAGCETAARQVQGRLGRMKGARKNAQGMITEPGNMVIYVAGYPAIMGLQPLYFKDSELARRVRIPAEAAQTKNLEDTASSHAL